MKKNYIIVAVISIATVLLVILGVNLYERQVKYNNENNFVLSVLSEVKPEELDNLVVENNDFMIYVANSEVSNSKIRKEVKKIIEKNDYVNDIVYLNSKNINDNLENFINNYSTEKVKDKKMSPDSLIIIKEGKIISITNLTNKNVSLLDQLIKSKYYGE